MSVARAGRLATAALRLAGQQAPGTQASAGPSSLLANACVQQRRWASGGHHGPGVTYEGLTLHRTGGWHKVAAESLTGLMWFWIFVRAYHDGHTLLFGHAEHFEHEAHGEGKEHH